jgi:hypothetical protein
MRWVRVLLGVTGVALALVGVWQLAGAAGADLIDIAVFLAGGVLAHDLLVGPLVVLAALVVTRLPSWWRAPVAVGLVVLSTVTLMAVPVLAAYGARPDVPSLLPRPYGLLWLVFAAVVVAVVVAASLLRRRSASAR